MNLRTFIRDAILPPCADVVPAVKEIPVRAHIRSKPKKYIQTHDRLKAEREGRAGA